MEGYEDRIWNYVPAGRYWDLIETARLNGEPERAERYKSRAEELARVAHPNNR